ncbi:YtxH-like protein [compost metagenome]
MSNENKGKDSKGWLWGAVIGTVVGSVTALLFAPKAGRELRKDIADGARQVGDKTQEVASKVSEKTQEVAGKVSEQSVQLAGKVKDSAGELVNDIKNWRASKQADDETLQISSVEDVNDADASADEETAVIGVADDTVEGDAESEAAAGEEASLTEEEDTKKA